MTDVSLAPLVSLAGQFVLAAAGAVITAAIPVIARAMVKYFHIKITDAQWAVVDRTAMNFARQIVAEAEPSLMKATIKLNDPLIASWAKIAIDDIPNIMDKLGLSPSDAEEAMKKYLLSHLGAMQAQAVYVPADSK